MIRICLADDQVLVRRGIRAVLEATGEVEVVAEAADGLSAIDSIVRLKPDIAVLDVRMPILDGIGVLQRLGVLKIEARVALLTTFDDDAAMIAGIRAGALAFILKDVEPAPLLATLKLVAAGRSCLAGLPAERLVLALQKTTGDGFVAEPLTMRERQVLGLLSAGLSNRDIAEALNLATGTVKNTVSIILAKLGTGDRTKAALKGIKDGLV